ncbi:Bbp16 family capsid cement protein [Sphingomonas beigongshangi]|uniref:Bbp16 family capsid cement protein n=1 Tax=Sphingomonas beigongshangi TaxID=2782540 RepID=UPI00193B262B|nr:hypothetical protein [Sphingomonas beigongshangi]
MIFDRTELFSDRQPITATTASTNVWDTGATGTVYGAASPLRRDMGKGNELPLAIRVTESFNNLTNLTVGYQVADDAAFTQNLTTVITGGPYTLAQLQAGAAHILPDEVPVSADRRYHRLYYTVTGTAPTTGRITASITAGNQTNQVL